MDDSELQNELAATVEARKELGPGHDEHLIEGFLERIDKEIDRRVEERIGHRRGHSLPLAAQLGPMIPIVIFAGVFAHTAGVIAALALVAVMILVNELRR
jgi:hypothetical protein